MNNYEAYFGTIGNVYDTLRRMCSYSDCNDCVIKAVIGCEGEDENGHCKSFKEWLMEEIS